MTQQIFKPIKQEKLSVKIGNQIKALIVDGELMPGDALPPERELMGLLNVSRPSIREALKSLVGMGFLEISKGNRTVVKSLVSAEIMEPLHQLLKEDITLIFQLLEVRKVIESWNAYYAAKRATLADIGHLEACIVSMKKKLTENGSTLGKEDADFHLAISEATHNKVQTHIMFTIYDLLKNSIGQYYENFDHNKIYQQHLEVVDAIKDKNSETARLKILEHLDYVESRVKRAVNTGDYTAN